MLRGYETALSCQRIRLYAFTSGADLFRYNDILNILFQKYKFEINLKYRIFSI